MEVVVGVAKILVDEAIRKECTLLVGDGPHLFPDELPEDFIVLVALLEVPPASRRLTSLNLSTFLRIRHFALEILGLITLNECLQTTFLQIIQQPNSKRTATALAFQGRGFTTVDEEKYVDRSIRRFKKKLTPIKLELVKVQ